MDVGTLATAIPTCLFQFVSLTAPLQGMRCVGPAFSTALPMLERHAESPGLYIFLLLLLRAFLCVYANPSGSASCCGVSTVVDMAYVALEAARPIEELPPPAVGEWVESKAAHQDAQIFRCVFTHF